MMQAPLPDNEDARLRVLRDYQILDTAAEADFDDFTSLAAHLCGTPRDRAFYAHAIHQPGVFTVPDAQADARFADNPLVTGDPDIRFYAGTTLLTDNGLALGTLCVIDHVPRTLAAEQV